MKHSPLRRISPAKAAIRPSMPEAARGFGPMECTAADFDVGARLQGLTAEDLERELHIEDAQQQYLWAYERFQAHGCPHDRDEALLHLHRMTEAILCRSPAVQAARHAAFEREQEARDAYFASAAAQELGQQGRAA